MLCDEIRIEVLQGHLSLGGLVEGVAAEADVVRASHLQHPCNNICNYTLIIESNYTHIALLSKRDVSTSMKN